MPDSPPQITTTIVGGGASAHVLIPFLAQAGHRVQVLTRRPEDWSEEIELQLQSIDEELLETFHGRLSRASKNPADVIPESDVVVLCMPVCAYRKSLHELAPHLREDREVFVGTIYGQAGFNWMVGEIAEKHGLEHVSPFAVGLIPWICRVIDYGRSGVTYGCKEVNVAAVSPRQRFDHLDEIFLHAICERWLGKGAFRQSDSFLSLTLSVDNQIIHPSRCFGLFERYGGRWPSRDAIPYFYRDFDELSADLLRDLDADYSKVRDGIRERFPDRDFPHMLDYLGLERLSYRSENTNIRESFTTSRTLGAIKPPVVQLDSGEWAIDTDHRFFTDDISYGVCIAKWMAEQMELEVPTIDAIITWVQELRGERYLEDGRLVVESESLAGPFRSGIPPVYGIHTLEGVVD
ncbi:MAG: NAD/NADP octopine/nopaline dehydrogenase family protein [Holophagales bacterium]|nr:NAD/NADP octopine/nopaline dehydrogenase family protein [Holophagales bacterium]